MDASMSFDTFMEAKNAKGISAFIFLLDQEYSHLDSASSWIHYSQHNIRIVRLSEDEFRMLDIGVHPKVIVYRNGRETKELNGIPSLPKLRSLLHKQQRSI